MASRHRNVVGRVAGAATGKMLDTLDPDFWLSHVDLDALLARVDVQRLVDRVDPNPLLERVDVQRLVERVDVNLLLASVDVEALVRRSGIPDIVAASTGRIAGSTLDLARRQVVGVDTVVGHGVDRLLRRRFDSTELVPARFTPTTTRPGSSAHRVTVTGHYGGPLGRLLGALVDAAIVAALFTAGYMFLSAAARLLFDVSLGGHIPTAVGASIAVLWPFAYHFVSLAVAGRTLGKWLVGLRVVNHDGSPVSTRRAFVRTVMMPVSAAVGGLGYVPIVLQKEHRALHDLVAGTAVLIDWGERPAELPAPLSAFISRHSDT